MKVKIGGLTKIKTGKLDANASSDDGKYPFFTCSKDALKISTYSYDCECVLVAGNGDLNVKYYNGKFDAYQRTYIIQSNGSGKLYIPYLYYFMERYVEELRKQAIGGVIKYIKLENLTDALIELPPINEQKAIVKILKKAKNILYMHKNEMGDLDNLIKARFVEMFGEGLVDDGRFPLLPISDIGRVVSGATPKTGNADYWEGNNIWITPAELAEKSFVIYDSIRKITDEGVRSCAVNLLPIGTVILSSRAPIGKVAIVGTPMYCNQGFKNIIPNKKINSTYLYELLSMQTGYLNSLGRGATFKEISKQIVENIKVKVPPMELQNEFADFVNQVDKSKFVLQKKFQIIHYSDII